MLSHNGLIKVLWVKAYAQGIIRLVGICQWQKPRQLVLKQGQLCLSGPFHPMHSLFVPIFYGNFLPGMLNWGNGWVCPDGVGPGHVTYSVKRVRKRLSLML